MVRARNFDRERVFTAVACGGRFVGVQGKRWRRRQVTLLNCVAPHEDHLLVTEYEWSYGC